MTAQASPTGLEAAFLENRERLLRFLAARGAGEDAEDVLQEIWLKITARRTGPVASPLSYLFRTADLLLIDRYRARRQADRRDRAWSDVHSGATPGVSDAPSADRQLASRQLALLVQKLLDDLEPPRVGEVFRRHRIDGLTQRQIAEEFGVSLSTVESDLRRAYKALASLREQLDEV
ncbi:RNA polymerase sigma factor [Aurantiacibacter xanthus]|uniref:RNA polymerase sigma factor n=1 Tax=Aurantiacibacter xanthus TaxID=1784712 RepID=A0A3A1P1G9_9SPHN|nr:RNA polymerase sigma factor [Aurantiacibacter xanthus]RIV82554.1 RNA polymerase sigma factor [Aurantiacibacter xanthus]